MITIVTGNTTKFLEMEQALAVHDISVQRKNAPIDEIQAIDQDRVVTQKALDAYAHIGSPVLVDDSGITFGRFKQFPGTYSKYAYQTLGFDGIFALTKPGERAIFTCAVAYMDEHSDTPIVFWGTYTGTICANVSQEGSDEMPYARIFLPDDSSVPLSMMTPLQRAHDHRHQALNAFAQWYVQRKI